MHEVAGLGESTGREIISWYMRTSVSGGPYASTVLTSTEK